MLHRYVSGQRFTAGTVVSHVKCQRGSTMTTVDPLTQFFLTRLREAEATLVEKGKGTNLANVYKAIKAAAPPDIDAEDAAMTGASMAIELNIHMALRELAVSAAKAGRVLCTVYDPNMAAEAGKPLTPEQLKVEAREAAVELVDLLEVMKELAHTIPKAVDCDHIVAQILSDHEVREAAKAKPAEPQVKAVPVSGTAKPAASRFEPSQN